MSRRLWLYSIKCTQLYDKKEFDFDNVHHILLFCLDENSNTHVVRVTEYKTFVTLLPIKADADRFVNFDGLVDDIYQRQLDVAKDRATQMGRMFDPDRVQPFVSHVEAFQARKLVGYTKSAPHWVLKLMLRRESDRHNVVNLLRNGVCGDEQTKMKIGTLGIEQIVHDKIQPATEFLHEHGLELAQWFEIKNWHQDLQYKHYFGPKLEVIACEAKHFGPISGRTPVPNAPQMRKLYIRIEAHSSTATKHNQHNPNSQFPQDVVSCISICTSDGRESSESDSPKLSEPRMFLLESINDKSATHLRTKKLVSVHPTEEDLLRAFGQCVSMLNVHVIVFASDEKCGPTSLIYLLERAKLYNKLDLGFSKMTKLTPRCEVRPCGKSGEYIVFDHIGVERIDICKILPRAMVSPNLDGFTLLDAIRHDNLVPDKYKPLFKTMRNLDYIGTNTFSTPDEVVADINLNLQLLRVIEQRCNFLMQQQDISRMCFVDVTSVVERGQQARVGNLFYKGYHKQRIVMNNEQTKKPFLVVEKPRQESSYPRPPWLDNPPKEAMRGAKRPGHVIREPLPPHVEYLLKEDHSNTFVVNKKHASDEKTIAADTIVLPQADHQQQNAHKKRHSDAEQTQHPQQQKQKRPKKQQTIVSDAHKICDRLADELQDHATRVLEQTTEESKYESDDEAEEDECKTKDVTIKLWWQGKRKADFAVKSRKKIKTQAEKDASIAYRGGSVLDPTPGYYRFPWEAVMTVDFASLYPSVMRAYSICYMRVIYDPKYLNDPDVEVEYVPITETHCIVLAKRERRADGKWYDVDTITPSIVKDVMQLRERVRTVMKSVAKGTFEYNVLDSQQLAAKTIANSVYGFTGSRTSQTPCTALAAAITQIGQWKIHTVRFVFLFLGHAALYGDTDSNMILFWVPAHLQTKDEILSYIVTEGMRVIAIYMQICVAPNNLEPETIKWPFLLLPKKKTYAAIQYKVEINSWYSLKKGDCLGECIKGMAAKKRDKCGFAQDIGCTLVKTFLNKPQVTFEELIAWFEEQLSRIPFGKITKIEDLNPFIITCPLNAEYKQDTKTIKAIHLADMTERACGARPRVGTRIPYVFTYKPKVKLQSQCCEIPAVFFANGSLLDIPYILVNQILNVTKQILSLPMHQPLFAMFEKCVTQHVVKWNNKQQKTREITHFFQKPTLVA